MRFRASSHTSRRGGRVLFWVAIAALGLEAAGFWLRSSQLRVSTAATPASTSPSATTAQLSTQPSTTAATVVEQSPAATAAAGIGSPILRPGSATYTLPAGTILAVTATADCWVEAREGAGGKLISAGTLNAGHTEQFTSPVWIRFGNPDSVKVTANGVPLQMTPDAPGDLIARSS